MSIMRAMIMAAGLSMGLAATASLSGCDNTGGKTTGGTTTGGTTTGGTTGGTTTGDDHDHDHDEGDHDHDHGTGESLELGQAQAGPFTIRATRDSAAIAAGGEALVDVWVTGGTVGAVRLWVGTQDGAGSVRARAEAADADEPNRYHTHAEVPDPMPEGAMLWVEVEDEAGATHTASFPLNP